VLHGIVAAYPVMAGQGFGHIVNTSSSAAFFPVPANAPYGTAKRAVVGLSLSLRLEAAELGVKVSCACPGFVRTNIYRNAVSVNPSLRAGVSLEQLAGAPAKMMPAARAAEVILDGVARNQALIVFPASIRWARTVPLVAKLVPVIERWGAGKASDEWLFDAPEGGPLRESNWKRSVGWTAATSAVGIPGFRVHDLRHAAASVWLAAGADPKVAQRVLGHATAAMTMDLYGHMIDANLWRAAQLVGDISGTSDPSEKGIRTDPGPGGSTKN
jgi:short chain dehydrogenase/Phage integrase family